MELNEVVFLYESIEKLRAERDAAVSALHELCVHDESPCAFCSAETCYGCIDGYPHWKWRG